MVGMERLREERWTPRHGSRTALKPIGVEPPGPGWLHWLAALAGGTGWLLLLGRLG